MKTAVENNALSDPLDKQISTRLNPVLQPNQRETARLILKEDLGHGAYAIKKVKYGEK